MIKIKEIDKVVTLFSYLLYSHMVTADVNSFPSSGSFQGLDSKLYKIEVLVKAQKHVSFIINVQL